MDKFINEISHLNVGGKEKIWTPVYVAPEVRIWENDFSEMIPYTLKADIWSTGLVFYFMLFGQNYFAQKGFGINGDFRKLEQAKREKTGINLVFDDQKNDIGPVYKDLLRGMIEPDPIKRMSWKEVFNHTEEFNAMGRKQKRKMIFGPSFVISLLLKPEALKVYKSLFKYIDFCLKGVQAVLFMSQMGGNRLFYEAHKFFLVKTALLSHRKAELIFSKVQTSIEKKQDVFGLKASFNTLCQEDYLKGVFQKKLIEMAKILKETDEKLAEISNHSLRKFQILEEQYPSMTVGQKDEFADEIRKQVKTLSSSQEVDFELKESLAHLAVYAVNELNVDEKYTTIGAMKFSIFAYSILCGDKGNFAYTRIKTEIRHATKENLKKKLEELKIGW